MVWEIVFMLVILKIPMIYLCVVCWWAIKSEPSPPDLAEVPVLDDTPPTGGAPRRRRPTRPRPMRPHSSGRHPVAPLQRGGVRS